jgi:hypothetical protein
MDARRITVSEGYDSHQYLSTGGGNTWGQQGDQSSPRSYDYIISDRDSNTSTHYSGVNAHGAEVLRVRGISPEIARDYGIESWTHDQAAADGFQRECARAGLAIPNYNILGELDSVQLRPEQRIDERKYLWKKGHSPQIGGYPASTPETAERGERLRRDLRTPVLASESNLKSAALLSNTQCDIYPLSIHGNWNWSKNGAISPELRWLARYDKRHGKIVYRRPFILVPDSNYWTKPEVMQGWWHFGNAARALGFDVRVAVVPHAPDGSSWGPDDAIAAGTVTVEELIANAVPLPVILPTTTTRPEDTEQLSEEERLRREIAVLKADKAAIIGLARNPHHTPTEKIAWISAGVELEAMAERGEVEPLDSGKIAHNYCKEKTPKGEPKQTLNHDGTKPLMSRKSAKSAMERATEMGWIVAKAVPHTVTRADGSTYPTTAWEVEPSASFGAFLMTAAAYTPETPKERATYGQGGRCKRCHQVHDKVQVTSCGGVTADGEIIDGCGHEISRKVIRAPLANQRDITPEQHEHLENITRAEKSAAEKIEASMTEKNSDIVNTDNTRDSINASNRVNTTSPAPPITCRNFFPTSSPAPVDMELPAPQEVPEPATVTSPGGHTAASYDMHTSIPEGQCTCGGPIPSNRKWTCSDTCTGTPPTDHLQAAS